MSAKKPWYKRWKVWAYTFGAIFVLGLFAPDDEEGVEVAAEVEDVALEVKAPDKTPEELAEITAETEAKNKAEEEAWLKESAEKAEKGAEEKRIEKENAEYAVGAVAEAYERFIAESEGVIVKIEPEEDYEIIYVQLADDFAYLPKELKQAFVDKFGGSIEANTRGQMFSGRGSADKLFLYFVNSKGEYLVDTKHFDYGWKAK